MHKLPFLTPPREPETRKCGNETSGILEIPVLGGLTVGEAAITAQLIGEEESAFVVAARASEAIAKAEEISLSEAFTVIDSSLRGVELEEAADAIRLRHAAAIEQVGRTFTAANQRTMKAQVTALLTCRLGLKDWTLADTEGLHRVLFSDLLQLVEDELDAESDPEDSPPADDELLGKPREETGTERKRTGRRSAGS